MADAPPIRIKQIPSRSGSSRLVSLGEVSLAPSGAAESISAPVRENVPAAIPPQVLGHLTNLSQPRLLSATLEALQKLHGGWGWVIYRVEDSVALSREESVTDEERPAPVLTPESIAVGPALHERYHQASGELVLIASQAAAISAVRSMKPEIETSELAGQACQVQAVPVFEGDIVTCCLCRVQDAHQPMGEASALAALQLTGLLRILDQTRSDSERIRSRFGKVAAFVEMLASSEGGTDFAECSRRLANHLREILECDTVALAVCRFGRTKMAAISGETGPAEAHSPGRRALLGHLSEAIHRRQPLLTRRASRDKAPSESSGAVSLQEWFDPALSYCLPLIDAEGNLRGGWVFLWSEEPKDFEEKESLIKAATPEVAPLLSLLHRAKPGAAVGAILRLWKRGSGSQRRLMTFAAVAAITALLVPIRYPVGTKCELQPVVRRVIAAPFDGILKKSTIRAGETVKKGQLLAELDGREVRSELAEAIARRERALKEADTALAANRIAESRMAAFEADGLGHEIERLEYRQEHLQVRSPIDGLVLQGDLERSEGAPLHMGDPLFEVGPLDRLIVEFAVNATDISLISVGDEAQLKLEAYTDDKIEAKILRISPKSEFRGDSNVFICEAEIENPDAVLRAGLAGKGKIFGPRRPLAWIWVRDACLALRYHLW